MAQGDPLPVMPARTAAALLLVLAGCAGVQRSPAPMAPAPPRAATAPPRAATPRPVPATPAARGLPYPACDPRAGDPDRGRVAIGILAGDCEDAEGRNRVYVTRHVGVQGTVSPAQRAGVQVGDRIVRFDSCEISSTHELGLVLRTAPPGWVPRVAVERGGREVQFFIPTVEISGKAAPAAAPHLSTAGCQAIGRKPARKP